MILDEIHLLGADRGPILEVLLNNCCNLFLSAATIMESKFSEFHYFCLVFLDGFLSEELILYYLVSKCNAQHIERNFTVKMSKLGWGE